MVSWFLWDPAPPFVAGADHYGVRVVGLVDNRHYPSLCLLTKSLFDSISFFFFVVSLYQSWYDSEPVLLGKQTIFFMSGNSCFTASTLYYVITYMLPNRIL